MSTISTDWAALPTAPRFQSPGTRGQRFPVGRSSAIASLERFIQQVARYESTVLLEGESGCGKELVAKRIHDLSGRRASAFVPVNCGAIPHDLLESELFGHEKGAFTGAVSARIGRFELAEGGTLFLDEIGDMSLDMQVKLLRVLQERVYERVGSHESRRANVRIIAATHRDLRARAAEGQFREDLYFRLNVFPIRVPPLRERLQDLPELIDELIAEGVEQGRPHIYFGSEALERLSSYDWPGNVRELANLVERLSILCPEQRIGIDDLPSHLQPSVPAGDAVLPRECRLPTAMPAGTIDLKEHLGSIEKQLIRWAIEQADGTVAGAARLLGLRRTTLVEKLRKYDLSYTVGRTSNNRAEQSSVTSNI